MSFGEEVTSLRKSHGMTRKFLAKELGIPYSTLTGYESGIREPRHDFIVQVANYFGVSTDILLGKTGIQQEEDGLAPELSFSQMKKIMESFDEINEEGREKLVDYAIDLVSSGRYKKHGETDVDKQEA